MFIQDNIIENQRDDVMQTRAQNILQKGTEGLATNGQRIKGVAVNKIFREFMDLQLGTCSSFFSLLNY